MLTYAFKRAIDPGRNLSYTSRFALGICAAYVHIILRPLYLKILDPPQWQGADWCKQEFLYGPAESNLPASLKGIELQSLKWKIILCRPVFVMNC